jgi:hypothetical protein
MLAALESLADSAPIRTLVAAAAFCSNLAPSGAGIAIELGFFFWIRGTGGITGLSVSVGSACWAHDSAGKTIANVNMAAANLQLVNLDKSSSLEPLIPDPKNQVGLELETSFPVRNAFSAFSTFST